jgi:hypothetical protein
MKVSYKAAIKELKLEKYYVLVELTFAYNISNRMTTDIYNIQKTYVKTNTSDS